MDHAISILQISLATALNNEPIRRAEGRIEEANADLAYIDDLSAAVALLCCSRDGHLKEPDTFQGKIARAINQHSLEAGSDTPDFILAAYLKRCLENFDLTMQARTNWYGPRPTDGEVPVETESQEYRMLEVGELIQEGDEWKPSKSERWMGVRKHEIGLTVSYRNVRRPVKRSLDS